MNNQFPLRAALGLLVTVTLAGQSSLFAAPVKGKPSVAKITTQRDADKELHAALGNPALNTSVMERTASVSKLAAYLAARTAAEKAYQNAVVAANKANRPAPANPFQADIKPDWYRAHLQELRERAFPFDKIDTDAILRGEDARDLMPVTTGVTHAVSIRGIDAQTLAERPELYRAKARVGTSKTITEKNIASQPLPNAVAGAQWEFVGPKNNTATQLIYFGPADANCSGRINGMAVSPTNSDTVFVATSGGGVWKTTNAGRNWAPVADNALLRQETNCVVIDPHNASNMLIGLGDAQGGEGQGFARGMLRSTDGGVTWAAIPMVETGVVKDAVSAIVYDPDTPGVVLATTRNSGGYRWRSTDGGVTWTRITDSNPESTGGTIWSSLSVSQRDTVNNRRFYYATGMSTNNEQAGLWRSADQGQTWTKIVLPNAYNNGTVKYDFQNGFRAVASATNLNIVYVLRASDKSLIKCVRNPDNDTYSFTEISGTKGQPGYFAQINWGQLFYNLYLNCAAQTVNGVVKDSLYVSLLSISAGLGVSDNDWTPNWVDFGKAFEEGSRTHADNHFSIVAPGDPNRLYVGNDGGFFPVNYDPAKSANPTLETWTFEQGRNANIGTTMFYQADFHPYNPNFMIGGLQDNGTPVATGDLNNWKSSVGGDGSGAAQDPVNPLRGFVLNNNLSVNLTTNGWGASRDITPRFAAQDAKPLIGYAGIDPNVPNAFYLGSNYLWRYSPLRGKWEARLGNVNLTGSDGGENGDGIRVISVAKSNSKTLYVGTPNGRLWVSFNNGVLWTNLSEASNGTLPNRAITSVSVSDTNDRDILLTVSGTGSGHVFRCADTSVTGATFTDLSATGVTGLPDVPFNTIARDFTAPDTIWFAGSDIGVFQTADGGQSWTNATQSLGLPAVSVRTLKAMPGTGYLMAATHGRSIWRLPLVSPLPTSTAQVKPRYITPQTLSWSGRFGDNSYNFDIPFTFGNVGGTDATNITITAISIKVNGEDGILDGSVMLPRVIGTALAGAGTATGTFKIRTGVLVPGTKYSAPVSISGTYQENGRTEAFDFNGRIELLPTAN